MKTIEVVVNLLIEDGTLNRDQGEAVIKGMANLPDTYRYANTSQCMVCGEDYGSQREVWMRKRRGEFAKAALPGVIQVLHHHEAVEVTTAALRIADQMIFALDRPLL